MFRVRADVMRVQARPYYASACDADVMLERMALRCATATIYVNP